MREIKFRAWKPEEKKMYKVTALNWVTNSRGTKRIPSQVITMATALDWTTKKDFIADDCELMQNTGLKDKNGKEIYEGDIWVVYSMNDKTKELERIEIKIDLSRNLFRGWRSEQGVIIGNIYENPELLKTL